ncbi:MAG: hypothetical protein NZ920_01535 [Aigarchaeota archaeon]|nr:hypothetical protein [Aigarchaeota archaeon]MDW8093124.1 hypothetical protein [Nitrososphaerota archaeon]
MKPEDRLYVVRLVLSLIVGLASAILSISDYHWLLNVLMAGLIYVATLYLVPPLIRMERNKHPRRVLITSGLGTYIFVWLASWLLFFNAFS